MFVCPHLVTLSCDLVFDHVTYFHNRKRSIFYKIETDRNKISNTTIGKSRVADQTAMSILTHDPVSGHLSTFHKGNENLNEEIH